MQPTTVHPHLPRFAQAITGVLCLEAVLFQDPWVVAFAAALVAVGRFAPRWSPVHWLFRFFARPAQELEPAAPVRFSQTIALTMLGAALVLFATGLATAGFVVAGVVAAIALFSAASGICVGCEMYRLLMLRRAAEGDVRGELGLSGGGPWVVVLTAPGCARCEPVARQVEAISGGAPVVRVDITRTPGAARLPVRSVPAVVRIGADGHVVRTAVGRLDRPQLEAVLAAA